jgi:peptide-methionine (S)-S-oxide reductase
MRTALFRATSLLGMTVGAFAFVARPMFSSMTHPAAPNAVIDAPRVGAGQETAVFAGGCFWGMQLVFEHVKGVTGVTAGYAGGEKNTATYEQVETGQTGHAESVRITFDTSLVTYKQLLQVFFTVHDPTELNRQGPDTGTQYRSSIFYLTPEQKQIAESYIAQLEKEKTFDAPIVTQVVPLPKGFFPAEKYHQEYAIHHPDQPYIVINDLPKVSTLRQQLPALYRDNLHP